MAFSASSLSAEPRSFSVGPLKMQLMTYSVTSGATSGTVTATGLKEISHIIVTGGLSMTAAPTYSNNVATLAFVDPAATLYGTIIVFGR